MGPGVYTIANRAFVLAAIHSALCAQVTHSSNDRRDQILLHSLCVHASPRIRMHRPPFRNKGGGLEAQTLIRVVIRAPLDPRTYLR